MSNQNISLLTLTVQASGAVTAHRFVTPVRDQAVAGENAIGVAQSDAADGDQFPVDVLGTTLVESGAAIAEGALIESDASGRAITQSAGATLARLAPGASASAAGDLVEVVLIPN